MRLCGGIEDETEQHSYTHLQKWTHKNKKNTYALYHTYRERRKSDLKSKLYWPGPPKTINCIGICLLKMLRNAVYSFAAPFAVKIVIVMIEHYIHTDLLRTYLCVALGQQFLYIVTKCIYTQKYIQEYVLCISICILLSTLGLCLFTSCYKL